MAQIERMPEYDEVLQAVDDWASIWVGSPLMNRGSTFCLDADWPVAGDETFENLANRKAALSCPTVWQSAIRPYVEFPSLKNSANL